MSPGERFGFVYEITMLRCIVCALRVEAGHTEIQAPRAIPALAMPTRIASALPKDVIRVRNPVICIAHSSEGAPPAK